MPQFQYSAMESGGSPVNGTIEAGQIQEAIAKLKGMGYYITSISPARGGSAVKRERAKQPASAKTASTKKSTKGKSISLSFGPMRIKTKELTIITRQLATLIGSGLPLLRALRVLREQRKGAANIVLGKVAEDIESGALFSEALAKHPRSFGRIFVSMVRAGEAGGALEAVLNRLAEFMEKEARLRAKIKAAMAYPTVIVIVATGILIFLMLKIVPTFNEIFSDMDAGELPGPTLFLMKISRLMMQRWYLIIIFIVAIVILFKVLISIKFTRYYIDLLKLRIVVFGPVISKTIVARFARTFATLITSGVPILQALQIVRDTTGNEVISKGINEIRNRVREGEGISGPMLRANVFPTMVTNMVAVGEETGAMDSMLEKIAEAYEAEVDTAVDAMTAMLEPILLVGMGGVVGFIVIALFLPLIKLAMEIQ